jgi:hypothetical protein
LPAEISRRAAPTVMRFGDYNQDGAETEFLLQIGTLPCGKVQYAAIGVTAGNPHLHALGSAAHPDALLAMPLPAWHALLLKRPQSTVALQACGDHGSEQRSELKLLQESDW